MDGSSVDDDSGFAPIDPHQKDKRKAYEVDFNVLSLSDIEKRQKDDAEKSDAAGSEFDEVPVGAAAGGEEEDIPF